MFPVADDFAEIARRMKEIQAEAAKAKAVEDGRRAVPADAELEPCDAYSSMEISG